MKKLFCLFISMLVIIGCMLMPASAQSPAEGSFTVFCYNVAGLPDIGFITGDEPKNVINNQTSIGRYVEENGFDIFAVQEDFGYHDNLVSCIPSYKYSTQHHGGVPYGDGTNIFTKSMPMYNEKHIPWEKLYGLADDGADELSQKGITYCCIEIADGIYIDFYDIHADAFGDAGSCEAREDNFRQLKELINGRTTDRAVIVTGDFNEYLFGDATNMGANLVEGAGLKDAWVEVCNNGNYDDCSYYLQNMGSSWTQKWGVWDSVERFMYKDGGGVHLECTSFEYIDVKNSAGKSCSDHRSALGGFTFTFDGVTVTEPEDKSSGKESGISEFFRRVVQFFRALILALTNFDTIREYLGI